MYFVYDLDKDSAKIINMETLVKDIVSLDDLFNLYKTDNVVGIEPVCKLYRKVSDNSYDLVSLDELTDEYSGFCTTPTDLGYDSTGNIMSSSKILIKLCMKPSDLSTITEDVIVLENGTNYLVWYNGIKAVLGKIHGVRAMCLEDGILKAVVPGSGINYKIVDLMPLLDDVEKSTKAQFLLRAAI